MKKESDKKVVKETEGASKIEPYKVKAYKVKPYKVLPYTEEEMEKLANGEKVPTAEEMEEAGTLK